MGWDPMVRENICTQAAGRTLAASLWTAYLKMIKTAKRQNAVKIIDRAFALEREARKANVPPEKILEMRQKEVRPIIEDSTTSSERSD